MALKAFLMAITVSATALVSPSFAGDKHIIDHEHVSVNFSMQHSKWAKYQGTIRTIAGEIFFDKIDVSKSSVKVEMATASVGTFDKGRDSDLQTYGFLNGSEFPRISFWRTRAEKTGDKRGQIAGNLSLAGVTKPVTLELIFDGEGVSN